jgi:hypothetical protein
MENYVHEAYIISILMSYTLDRTTTGISTSYYSDDEINEDVSDGTCDMYGE